MSTRSKDITVCNFCDATEAERKHIVKRDIDTAICDICVILCVKVLVENSNIEEKVIERDPLFAEGQ